jgi:hypothetical protein
MSNSKNNMEEGSNGTDESAPRANDSTSNKKTRFTKSKSISEVFNELEFEDEISEDSYSDDSSVDEIIPIHNEYKDLESDAFDEESIEGGVIINPDLDALDEANLEESAEIEDYDLDADEEDDADVFSESTESIEDIDDEDSLVSLKDSDDVLADEDIDENIGQSSQGVLINDEKKSIKVSDKSFDLFNSSTIITIVGFIVGLAILLIGITYYASSSDRVVDNVLSGETAGLAIFLVIIGLIIIGFSLLKFFSSSKSSLIIDTFNSIKSIDYDDISDDVISRDDFDAIFSIFKRNKDSDFSDNGDNDKSVDSSKDLDEKDKEDKVSDDDIDSLYSESNLTSQKNQSSFKEHENADSTEVLDDNDDGIDEIIPIHSRLNEQSAESAESDLEDKYSKYDFEDESEDYDLVDEIPVEEDLDEESLDDSFDANDDFDEVEEAPVQEETVLVDDQSPIEEESEIIDNALEENIEEDANSDLELERNDELEDKYSKYDFDDDDDYEMEEPAPSKPQFKKSVDLSKFDSDALSEEELAEKERKAQELAEKKRRIIEGTNFDNSLRKE